MPLEAMDERLKRLREIARYDVNLWNDASPVRVAGLESTKTVKKVEDSSLECLMCHKWFAMLADGMFCLECFNKYEYEGYEVKEGKGREGKK